jgi:hypothetical protein
MPASSPRAVSHTGRMTIVAAHERLLSPGQLVHRRRPAIRWLLDPPFRRSTLRSMVSRAASRCCGAVLLLVVLGCGGNIDRPGAKPSDDGGSDQETMIGSAESGSSASSGAGSGVSSGSAGSSGLTSSSGGSSGSGSSSAFARPCGSGVDCALPNNPNAPPGLVCCITSTQPTSACLPSPCPSATPIGPVQLCATTAECAAGDVCAPLTIAGTLMIAMCTPLDAGNPPPCGPQTCTGGCCDTSGMCRSGSFDQYCGNGGAACIDCTAASGTCPNRACSTSVDASRQGD